MILFLLTAACTLILQLTVFSFYPVCGIKPDLLLILVINTALLTGSKKGLGTGFFLGLLQDLFLGGMFGVYTIIKTLLGGLIGYVEGHFYKKNIFVPFLVIFIFTIIHEFLTIFLSQELIFTVNYWQVFVSTILPLAVYNAFLGLILYFILYKILISRGKFYE